MNRERSAAADNPFVSVIVPVRNFERTIDKTFEYLLNIDYPQARWEIIIADGGSTDKTLEIIRSWQNKHDFIKLIQISECPSPAFARNKAMEAARGDFLFFTDGDCAPCRDWIDIMLRHFKRDASIGVVGGEIYTLRVTPDNLTEAYCEHFKFNMVSPRYGFIGEGYFPALTDRRPSQIAGHRAYFFVTANVAYRKEALDKAKARFWSHATGEDIDMCIQIQNRGWKMYFAPQAKVDHMHRGTFSGLRKVWVTYGMAHPPLLRKHSTDYFEVILQIFKRPYAVSIPSRFRGFVYLGNFHLMHMFALFFIIGFLAAVFNPHLIWLRILTMLALVSTLYFLAGFYRWCLYMRPRKYFFVWCYMKYLTNFSFIIGGLKESKRYKTFCIEPSF